MINCIIKAIGSYTPSKVLSNSDLEKIVDTNDEWITTRTGIKKRRISTGEKTYEMAIKAVDKTFNRSGMSIEDIDLIIGATSTPDYIFPGLACLMQNHYGNNYAMAFDIQAGCSGFVYAIDIAQKYIMSGAANNVLIVASEILSKITDWKKRETCVLFGDGAGAAIISKSDNRGIINTDMHADGSGAFELTCESTPLNNCFVTQEDYYGKLYMNGRAIYKFASNRAKESINIVLDKAGLKADDIKHYILHQANIRIIQSISKAMNQPLEKFYTNIQNYGNTSAATVLIAMDEMIGKDMLKEGDLCVITAFGAGLTWGSVLVEWRTK